MGQLGHGGYSQCVFWPTELKTAVKLILYPVGGTHDFSLIIDFLAAYLFPNGEKIIDEFMATGISLGGECCACPTDRL